jgi:hypothetical protein
VLFSYCHRQCFSHIQNHRQEYTFVYSSALFSDSEQDDETFWTEWYQSLAETILLSVLPGWSACLLVCHNTESCDNPLLFVIWSSPSFWICYSKAKYVPLHSPFSLPVSDKCSVLLYGACLISQQSHTLRRISHLTAQSHFTAHVSSHSRVTYSTYTRN